MKRLALGLVGLVSLAFFGAPVHAGVQDFNITSFTGDYYLSRDQAGVSQMRVREEIVADFPSVNQNHGILRAIPQSYDGHSLELAVMSVAKANGESWQYETSEENGNLVLKIGDPDAYVHGSQTYIIEYAVRSPISFDGSERLFWDTNGDQWSQKFDALVARVHIPAELASAYSGEARCVTGEFGSQDTTCRVEVADDAAGKTLTFMATRQLLSYQTLTFDVYFTGGTFAHYTMSAGAWQQMMIIIIAIIVPPLITLWFVVRRWRKYGRDAKGSGVIVPQYLPPKNMSVLSSSSLLYQGFRSSAISATIIDLAVRHYIKVYETGKTMLSGYEYDVELVKSPKDLLPEEQRVVTLLFADASVGSRVSLKDLSKTLYTEAEKIGEGVDVAMTTQGYFVQSPNKARAPFIFAGVVMAIAGVFFVPYSLGLIFAGVICFVGAIVMVAPTQKGAEAKEYLHGLKKYMKLAEAERLNVLQSPDGSLSEKIDVANKGQLVKLYERLLPYAVLFGIEKKWAQEFADLYEKAPDWYSGTGTFNAVYFAGALTSFDTAMTQSFSPPSSSSSGAGGSGGGGGGGGW